MACTEAAAVVLVVLRVEIRLGVLNSRLRD